MHNGNGGQDYNRKTYTTGPGYTGGDAINVGGFRIKPLYFYIAVAAILLIVASMLVRVLNTSLVMHFSLITGALLLLANVRELLGYAYAQHNNTALLNCLVGGALVCAWLSQVISGLLWVPAIMLVAVAVPLVLNRTSVYGTYVRTARSAYDTVRRAVRR